MKVIDERKKKTVLFNSLEIGKVFFFEDVENWGNFPYISIEGISDADGDFFNAVDLTDGTVVTVGNCEKVVPCEAILTVK